MGLMEGGIRSVVLVVQLLLQLPRLGGGVAWFSMRLRKLCMCVCARARVRVCGLMYALIEKTKCGGNPKPVRNLGRKKKRNTFTRVFQGRYDTEL